MGKGLRISLGYPPSVQSLNVVVGWGGGVLMLLVPLLLRSWGPDFTSLKYLLDCFAQNLVSKPLSAGIWWISPVSPLAQNRITPNSFPFTLNVDIMDEHFAARSAVAQVSSGTWTEPSSFTCKIFPSLLLFTPHFSKLLAPLPFSSLHCFISPSGSGHTSKIVCGFLYTFCIFSLCTWIHTTSIHAHLTFIALHYRLTYTNNPGILKETDKLWRGDSFSHSGPIPALRWCRLW